jgi:hypothetical protein
VNRQGRQERQEEGKTPEVEGTTPFFQSASSLFS